MSAADGVHACIFCDFCGFVETVRVGFMENCRSHCIQKSSVHFRLRHSGAEYGAKVCSVVVAEAGLEVSLRGQPHAVAGAAEFAVYGADQTHASLIPWDGVVDRRAEAVPPTVSLHARLHVFKFFQQLRVRKSREIFSESYGHHLNKSDVHRHVPGNIDEGA